MVATQNIYTLGPIWTFLLRGVLTFVASGLDISSCVLSYFEGTANLHCYTSFTLTTLHCSKVSFLQCCHMNKYNKIFTKIQTPNLSFSLITESHTPVVNLYVCTLFISALSCVSVFFASYNFTCCAYVETSERTKHSLVF